MARAYLGRPVRSLTFLIALCFGYSVWARAAPQRLSYTREVGAESCPSEEQLKLRVAAGLGYDPFTADASAGLNVRVARRGDVWIAGIGRETAAGTSGVGRRELRAIGSTCEQLAAALELALVLAIDPLAQVKRPPEETET